MRFRDQETVATLAALAAAAKADREKQYGDDRTWSSWTKEDDEELAEMIAEDGPGDWQDKTNRINERRPMKKRTRSAVVSRYHAHKDKFPYESGVSDAQLLAGATTNFKGNIRAS